MSRPEMRPDDWRRFTALLKLIRSLNGVGPSFREIGDAWGISSKGMITSHIDRLAAAGLIRRLSARHRAIEIATVLLPVRNSRGDVELLPSRVTLARLKDMPRAKGGFA